MTSIRQQRKDRGPQMTKHQRKEARLKALNTKFWKLPITYKIPFDRDGNLSYFPVNSCRFTEDGRYVENNQTYRWEENFEFDDTLKYKHCVKSKHSVIFVFESTTTQCTYPMFLIDFLNLIKGFDLKRGEVKTTWTFLKIGRYYGIVPVSIKREKQEYKNKGISKPFPHKKAQPPSSVV